MAITLDGTNGITTPALENDGVTTVAAGSASAPAITTDGDTNTGIFFPAADTIAFAEGGAEAMRIDSSGNVLVGTTDTSLFNNTSGTGVCYRAGASFDVLSASDNALILNRTGSDGGIAEFRKGGNVVGSISVTGSATAYNTSSDYRLKHDIQPMIGALAKVQQLKPVTYKWNADNSESQGFIAHELAEIVPEAVSGEKDAVNEDGSIKPQGIDTSFLVATLTAAIQELSAKNDALEARIAALEGARA